VDVRCTRACQMSARVPATATGRVPRMPDHQRAA
jgi:hypothetical protein